MLVVSYKETYYSMWIVLIIDGARRSTSFFVIMCWCSLTFIWPLRIQKNYYYRIMYYFVVNNCCKNIYLIRYIISISCKIFHCFPLIWTWRSTISCKVNTNYKYGDTKHFWTVFDSMIKQKLLYKNVDRSSFVKSFIINSWS